MFLQSKTNQNYVPVGWGYIAWASTVKSKVELLQ